MQPKSRIMTNASTVFSVHWKYYFRIKQSDSYIGKIILCQYLFFLFAEKNHMHMDQQPQTCMLALALAFIRGKMTRPLDPWPSVPLINTLWPDLISPQCHPSLSVVEQLETAQEGEENMHLREESRRGEKQASTQARRCIFMHPCLKCQDFLTLSGCRADTSPRFNRNRIH